MSENDNKNITTNSKISNSIEEIANINNPFKLFLNIWSFLKEISNEIEDTSVDISEWLDVNNNPWTKQAIIYSVLWKRKDIKNKLKNDKELKKEEDWRRLQLEKWVLSKYPNYTSLSIHEKIFVVHKYYWENDKDTKINNLILEYAWEEIKYDLVDSEKLRIEKYCSINQEKAITELINFGKYLQADPEKAIERESFKCKYYNILWIWGTIKDIVFYKENFSEEINSYIKEKTEIEIKKEISKIKSRFESKLNEANRNSLYYQKLSNLKGIIINLTWSVLSPIFLPFVLKKLSRSFDKNSRLWLAIAEFVLANHFSKNYQEYYLIKKFFKNLNKHIDKKTWAKWIVYISIFILSLFIAPLFFSIILLAIILILVFKDNHSIRKFALEHNYWFWAIFSLIICAWIIFSVHYTKNDFYNILYDKNRVSINYFFLNSWNDLMSNIKSNLLEGGSNKSSLSWENNKYSKCMEFNYLQNKKSCLE